MVGDGGDGGDGMGGKGEKEGSAGKCSRSLIYSIVRLFKAGSINARVG